MLPLKDLMDISNNEIVDYTDFAIRWIHEHPNDRYLPPMLGGPVDEIFSKNQALKDKLAKKASQNTQVLAN